MSDLVARHKSVRGRIRKEELRTFAIAPPFVPLRGGSFQWTHDALVPDPGVYGVPWDTEISATADVTWSAVAPEQIHVLTPGLWAAQVFAAANLGADDPTIYDEGARLVARLKLDGVEVASEVGGPFPVPADADVVVHSDVEAVMPPTLVAEPAALTLELLPGFGAAGPTAPRMKAASARVIVYLVTEIA